MSSKTLDKIFNDPKTGFVGEEKLFRRAHSIDPDITRKMVKDYLKENEVHQLFSKPQKQPKNPKIHGKIGHYQADLTFLTKYKKQNSNYHILLNVINVNTKFAYVEPMKDKRTETVLHALETIRKKAANDGRPIAVLQTDNGSEFVNNSTIQWMRKANITPQYCQKDDKRCLGVAERFNRTIKLMIEKYLTSKNSNRYIDRLKDFVANYNSSYHSGIQNYPERLEIFDEAELIQKNIKHNKKLPNLPIAKGDFVRLLNKRGVFEKEGQRYTGRIFIVEKVGLNSIKIQGCDTKFKISEILKVPPESREISNSLRERQLNLYKADKRLREREGIMPNRSNQKRQTRSQS
jgi:Integrase core domain